MQPKLCIEILEKGTFKRREYKLFHPKMCRAQKQILYCDRNRKCYFTHFKEAKYKELHNSTSHWGNPNPNDKSVKERFHRGGGFWSWSKMCWSANR